MTPLRPYEHNISHSTRHSGSDNRVLFRSSGINYDDYDLLVAKSLVQNPLDIVNPINAIRVFRDKNWQADNLRQLEIESIPTYSIREFTSFKSIHEFSTDQSFVVKTQRGLGGKGVFLFKDLNETRDFLDQEKAKGDQRYIIQPFIPKKVEIRAFFINGQLEYLIEKEPFEGSFKGNKDSCESVLFEPSSIVKEQIIQISKKLSCHKLSYFALDLFLVDEKVITLEVNLSPGFEILEEITKDNVASKILAVFR